jgi:Spy/CpxP family protein refolding chaperone
MVGKVLALVLAGLLAVAATVGTARADDNSNNPPPPCQGHGHPGCSGGGGS